jgi:integrase/recombinase XerD
MSGKKGFAAVAWLRERAPGRKGGKPKAASLAPEGAAQSDSLATCAAQWLEALRARNYAVGTLATREQALRFFGAWAAERDLSRVGEVTRPVLEAYQRWLARYESKPGKRLGWTSQRHRLAVLRDFFRWATRQNLILHNPASEIELPRTEQRLPVGALSRDELARLFAVPDLADPLGLRDRAMLEVFYATGLRRLELCRLECADVRFDVGTLAVRQGKGRKDRVVPLGAGAVFWVRRYLDEVRPRLLLDAREPGLFLTGYGAPFHPVVLTRQVGHWLKAAGLSGRGSCHLLRHTCATHMLEGGADIRFIQQLLGHACLETTAIYADVTIKQLLEVHARCHPSASARVDPTANPATTTPPTARA